MCGPKAEADIDKIRRSMSLDADDKFHFDDMGELTKGRNGTHPGLAQPQLNAAHVLLLCVSHSCIPRLFAEEGIAQQCGSMTPAPWFRYRNGM
jgi:hypothetical protein